MCEICDDIIAAEGAEPGQKDVKKKCLKCGSAEGYLLGAANPAAGHPKHDPELPPFHMTACTECGCYLKMPGVDLRELRATQLDGLPPSVIWVAGAMNHSARLKRDEQLQREVSETMAEVLAETLKRVSERKAKKDADASGAPASPTPPAPPEAPPPQEEAPAPPAE